MKRSNATARRICWLTIMTGVAFFSPSEFGAGNARATGHKRSATSAITIVDQNGRPVPNARPSATSQIFDVTVGPGGVTVFSPDTVNISTGDTVRWTWGSSGHSVTSGGSCAADSQFCSPDDMNCPTGTLSGSGTIYQHTFAQAGAYTYFCAAHCARGMVGTINVTAACTPPPPNMISWWPGENNGFDIQDGNDLVAGNGNGFGFGAGEVGRAFTFDGSQFATAGAPTNLRITGTAVTIDGWINPSTTPGGFTYLFGRAGSGTHDYTLALDGSLTGIIKTNIGDPGLEHFVHTGYNPPLNQWTHVALTYDGSTITVYANGVVVGTGSKTGNITDDGSFAPFNLGGRSDCCPYTGAIDEVEVFNRTLMANEIAAIYNAGSAGKCHTCATPPTNMVLWLPGENNVRDIAGGNNGTLQNGTGFATGKVGQAFSFDGSDDQITVAHRADQNVGGQLTIDAWVNPSALSHGRTILQKRSSSNIGGYGIETVGQPFGTDNSLQFYIMIGGTYSVVTTGSVLTLNTWQHVAGTYDGTTMKIYVDGVEKASGPASGAIDSVTDPIVIGRNVVATQDAWQGQIDEVELYNRALTPAEVVAIVNAGAAGKCKPPQPTAAFSRKTHGGAGTFDIDLNPNGTPGVECRSGGASGVYQMIVQFGNPVTVAGAAVTEGSGSVSGFSVSGAVVTIDLTGITNVQTIVVKLTGVNDGTLSGDVPVAMGVLLGDTNGNRAVSASDVAQTKAQSGQGTTAANFRTDVNASGSISAADIALVKSKSGTILP